jgi:predicted GIY-YIG superfamily endonuclease
MAGRGNGALYVGVTNNLTRADQHLGNRLAWIPACAGMTDVFDKLHTSNCPSAESIGAA